MSVDYSVKYGIGFEVSESNELLESEDYLEYYEEALDSYIFDELNEGYTTFYSGGEYSSEEDFTYIVIDDPFKFGLDLTKVKEALLEELSRLKVEPISDFSVVGCLHTY